MRMENGHPKVAILIHPAPGDLQAAVDKAYIRNTIESMIVGQTSFAYSQSEVDQLVEFISPERLQMYIAMVRFAKDPASRLRQGIRNYEKNTCLSEALYPVLQGFEVTFRNATHNRLTTDHNPQWFDTFPLLLTERDAVEDAKRTIEAKPQNLTPGRIVAELSFGFWVRLFSAEYSDTLWGPSLSKLIEPATNDRRAVYRRLQDIKTLRNRVAHHNRIMGRSPNVRQMYEETLEAIGWFSPTVKAWVSATNSVELSLKRQTIAVPR